MSQLFFWCCDKISRQKQSGEDRLVLVHSWRVQPIAVGKSPRQEPEASGHIIPTIRKQRLMNT